LTQVTVSNQFVVTNSFDSSHQTINVYFPFFSFYLCLSFLSFFHAVKFHRSAITRLGRAESNRRSINDMWMAKDAARKNIKRMKKEQEKFFSLIFSS